MLSFLYRIATEFEASHGYPPNLLYINPEHFAILRSQLASIPHLEGLSQFLGMDIVLTDDAMHPHIAWHPIEWQRAIA